MTDHREDWVRIRQVFEAALAQPAERQAGFVHEACRGEESIRDGVLALLASHKNASTFLEKRVVDLGPAVRAADLTGQQIGPYQFWTCG